MLGNTANPKTSGYVLFFSEATDHDLMAMLQTLLAERFRLALHREAKPIEAYVLESGKNGPELESGYGGDSKTVNRR